MFSNRKIILIIILLLAATVTAYVVVVIIPARFAAQSYEGAKRIGKDFADAFRFTPEITVNNTVVLQQQIPLLELTTLSQKFQHQYVWTNTWAYSRKKIKIIGVFEAKAGFDLQEKFTVDIGEDKAVVTYGAPRLLSIESMGDVTFEDEHGAWNWVKSEDRANAMNAFIKDAKKYAREAAFVQQAQLNFEDKVREIFASHGKEVVFRYGTAVEPAK